MWYALLSGSKLLTKKLLLNAFHPTAGAVKAGVQNSVAFSLFGKCQSLPLDLDGIFEDVPAVEVKCHRTHPFLLARCKLERILYILYVFDKCFRHFLTFRMFPFLKVQS